MRLNTCEKGKKNVEQQTSFYRTERECESFLIGRSTSLLPFAFRREEGSLIDGAFHEEQIPIST